MKWKALADKVMEGDALTRQDALSVLQSPDDDLLAVLDAAFIVRRHFFGREVNLHVLMNAKSGLCSEDCAFCSQSAVSDAPIPRYPMRSVEEIVEGARAAARMGAVKYCMVTSSRAPSAEDLDAICRALRLIRQSQRIHLCVSPGLLSLDQARQLKEAGADRINHNLETSRRYFPRICTAHGYDDRIATVRNAKAAGLEICCGGLMGMGESPEDRVDLALTLRDLRVHSIPVNFFDPRPGTPLAGVPRISPADGLRALAMFRLANPSCDIRAAGGREAALGHLQALALYAANSIFTEGYLTTPGQGYSADMAMLKEAGFSIGKLEA